MSLSDRVYSMEIVCIGLVSLSARAFQTVIVCLYLVSLLVGVVFAAMADRQLRIFHGVAMAIRMPDCQSVEI